MFEREEVVTGQPKRGVKEGRGRIKGRKEGRRRFSGMAAS